MTSWAFDIPRVPKINLRGHGVIKGLKKLIYHSELFTFSLHLLRSPLGFQQVGKYCCNINKQTN